MSGLGGAGLTPGPVEPRAKRLDIAGVDSRAAPDADAGRRIAITRHVIGRLFAFQQRGPLLDERKLGFVVETLRSAERTFGKACFSPGYFWCFSYLLQKNTYN